MNFRKVKSKISNLKIPSIFCLNLEYEIFTLHI